MRPPLLMEYEGDLLGALDPLFGLFKLENVWKETITPALLNAYFSGLQVHPSKGAHSRPTALAATVASKAT